MENIKQMENKIKLNLKKSNKVEIYYEICTHMIKSKLELDYLFNNPSSPPPKKRVKRSCNKIIHQYETIPVLASKLHYK